MVHTFNPSTLEAEAGGSLSLSQKKKAFEMALWVCGETDILNSIHGTHMVEAKNWLRHVVFTPQTCHRHTHTDRCNFKESLKMATTSWKWFQTPLIPALRGQRQADLWVYGQTARATQRNPVSKNKNKAKRQKWQPQQNKKDELVRWLSSKGSRQQGWRPKFSP